MCLCTYMWWGIVHYLADKGTSLFFTHSTISTAHQHMRNMHAHLLALPEETHVLIKVIFSEYPLGMSYAVPVSMLLGVQRACTLCMFVTCYCMVCHCMCEMCMEQSSYSVHEGIIGSPFHPYTVEPVTQGREGSDEILSQRVHG